MTMRITVPCVFALSLPAIAAGQPVPDSAERLSLETAIRLATDDNRQLQTARLQIEKADADLAAARTRRLPVFETEATASQLLSPVDFAFPQGAFGDFPGTGPHDLPGARLPVQARDEEALLDAGIIRLRPVLITVAATVTALFPLAAHGGPLWEPLCYAQIGGLTLATFVTLLLVPVLYATAVLDLKVVRWETREEKEEKVAATAVVAIA